jgi:hypothetical protein
MAVVMGPGFGYGYNCAVITDPGEANLPEEKVRSSGTALRALGFGWHPTNDGVFVGMIQRMTSPDNHPLLYRSQAAVYSALVNPAK